MPTEKTQTRSRNKTENKPKKNHAKTKNPKQNTASAGQFMTSVTWRKVIALYHPRCFFCARARCLSAGLRYLKLTRLPRHDRGPVPGRNRSAASCLCTVLRRALYHYATRSPVSSKLSSSGLERRSNQAKQNRQQSQKPPYELCEKGNQYNTARKPGLPPARSPEITV